MDQKSDLNSGTFWDRVCSMPFMKSSANVYLKTKEKSAIVGTGLGVIESGVRLASVPVKSVASSFAAAYPQKGTTNLNFEGHRGHAMMLFIYKMFHVNHVLSKTSCSFEC